MVLVWQIMYDSPNLPNFPPDKLSRYRVFYAEIVDEHLQTEISLGHVAEPFPLDAIPDGQVRIGLESSPRTTSQTSVG